MKSLTHVPVVRIVAPLEPTGWPASPMLSTITVDGEHWPVIAYSVNGESRGDQRVTLTFYADVEITHRPDPEARP